MHFILGLRDCVDISVLLGSFDTLRFRVGVLVESGIFESVIFIVFLPPLVTVSFGLKNVSNK